MLPVVAGLVAGPLVWSFMEYALHRFAFHEMKGKNYGSREHLRHHGSEDTVLESWYLSWAGVLLVGLVGFRLVGNFLVGTGFGWGLGIGYVLGYGFYDWIHWRAHRRPIRNEYERRVRKHHFTHHFHTPMQNQGVTTVFWDRVFGTLVEVDKVQVPRRMAMRWLIDEEGEVRPEYRDDYELRGTKRLDDGQKQVDLDDAFANLAPAMD